MMRLNPWIAAALLCGVALLAVFLLAEAVPSGAMPNVVYLLILLVALGGSLLAQFRRDLPGSIGQAALWILIIGALILAYSYRGAFLAIGERMRSVLLPHQGMVVDERSVAFAIDESGHYLLKARVDGSEILFLVDTGASDVVLSRRDARRLGYDPAQLDFSQLVRTANGVVRVAPVRIGEIAVGPIRMRDLPASVNAADMPVSLLGMEFLRRLSAWRVEDGKLTLRQ